MKTKKIENRLSLNKATIVNLSHSEMKDVYGADITSRAQTICKTNCQFCDTETSQCTAVMATCTTSIPMWTC